MTSFLKNEVAPMIGLRPVTISSIETIGGEVLIELDVKARGFHSGVELESTLIFHVTQLNEDGKVQRVRAYFDRDQAVRAAETGEG